MVSDRSSHHVGLVVSDLAASDRFYTEALKSLGSSA